MKKSFKRVTALCLAAILVFMLSPEIVVKAAESTWKTIAKKDSVASTIYAFTGDNLVLIQESQMALCDEESNVLGVYDDISYDFFEDGTLFIVKKGNDVALVNSDNKVIIPAGYDDIHSSWSGRYVVTKGGKSGLVSKSNTEIIPCVYEQIDGFTDGVYKVKKDGEFGLVSESNTEIIPCAYEQIDGFADGVYKVKKDSKFGLVSESNTEIIPCDYEQITHLTDDVYMVKQGEFFGLKAENGDTLLENTYHSIKYAGSDFISADASFYTIEDNVAALVEFPGYEIIQGTDSIKDGYFKVVNTASSSQPKEGYLKQDTGAFIEQGEYDDIQYLGDDFFAVKKDQKCGLIDSNRTVKIPLQEEYTFNTYSYLGDGYFSVAKEIKLTSLSSRIVSIIVDADGNMIIPVTEEYIYHGYLGNGYFRVSKQDEQNNYRFGIVDASGNIVLPIQFGLFHLPLGSDTINFTETLQGTYSAYTISLKQMASCPKEYSYIRSSGQDGYYLAVKEDKKALVDSSFRLITNLGEYDSYDYIGDGYYRVSKDKKYGVIDSQNNIIKNCTYDYIYISNPEYGDVANRVTSFTDNTIIMYKSTAQPTPGVPTTPSEGTEKSYTYTGNASDAVKTIKTTKANLGYLAPEERVLFDYSSISFAFTGGILNNLAKNDADEINLEVKENNLERLKSENKALYALAQNGKINPLKSFDINLNIAGTQIHELGDYVEIKISLADVSLNGINPSTLEIYYYNTQTNKLEAMNAVYDAATNTIVFKTDHFSTYLLGVKDTSPTTVSPDTSDHTNTLYYYGLMFCSMGFLIWNRKNKKKADKI